MQPLPRLIGAHAFFFREGDPVNGSIGTASRARNANVSTITTAAPHGMYPGLSVALSGLGGVGYNVTAPIVAVPSGTSFTIANAGANEAATADTGGVVTLTGVCSKLVKPLPYPYDQGWIDQLTIEQAGVQRDGNDIKLYGPNPGKIVLKDVLRNKHELMLKYTIQEWTAHAKEVLFLTNPLTTASTQYNPLEGPDKKGWLKIQLYDQNDNLIDVFDHWCRLSIDGEVQFGGSDVVKPAYSALLLQSPYNTGLLYA